MMYILKYDNNDDNDAYACIIFIYPCNVIDIYLYVYW